MQVASLCIPSVLGNHIWTSNPTQTPAHHNLLTRLGQRRCSAVLVAVVRHLTVAIDPSNKTFIAPCAKVTILMLDKEAWWQPLENGIDIENGFQH